MDLKSVNTSKFLCDPKSKTFYKDMVAKSTVFDLGDERVLTYITLVYDTASEVRRNYKEYILRKIQAAETAGFSRDKGTNRFDKQVEDMLLGEISDVNRAIVQYVYFMFSNDYKLLYVLEEKFNEATDQHSTLKSGFTSKDQKLLTDMKDQIEELEAKIFGGAEVINLRKALYEGTDNARVRIRKENEMDQFEKDGLDSWSPYPNYRPEKLKFVGDVIPK